jgi:hypothetical protein
MDHALIVSQSAPLDEAPVRSRWNAEPTLREIMLLTLLSAILFAATILQFQNYRSAVTNFGDSEAYASVASAIHHWDFTGLQVKQFWGYPYAVAAVAALIHVSEQTSLLLVSVASSFISVLLAYRLWGGWIAGLFALLNFDWMQRSFLGGSEPLAVALIFGAFFAVRRERYLLAAFLASLSTVVRPAEVLCLIGIGIVLLYRRKFKELLSAMLIGTLIGVLYILPFWIYLGDPLYQVHRYKAADWQSGWAVAMPFYAIGKSLEHNQEPWTNVVLTVGWIVFVLIGALMMAHTSFREYSREHTVEAAFGFLYIVFLFTYNSSQWARAEFVRFAIPVLPLVLLSLCKWIPKSRVILYSLAVLSSALAACSAIGIRNVVHILGL